MLLEHLTIDPAWLERRLDFPRPLEYGAEGVTQLLWIMRRYCAKLLYEIEFHQAPDVTAMQSRYVELLAGALKISPSETDYLADIDDGFYSSEYLRAWAFEAQLRDVPPREVRERLVHTQGCRLAHPRALVRGAEADGGRDPPRGHRSDARARGGGRADPRGAR